MICTKMDNAGVSSKWPLGLVPFFFLIHIFHIKNQENHKYKHKELVNKYIYKNYRCNYYKK
jgi:hypothetical protein